MQQSTTFEIERLKCDYCFGVNVEVDGVDEGAGILKKKKKKSVKVVHFLPEQDTSKEEKVESVLKSEENKQKKELNFLEKILLENNNNGHRHPLIIKGCDIGTCTTKWSLDYLKNVNPTKLVKVHKSKSPQLDFRNKNFKYETITFRQLVNFCSKGTTESVEEKVGACAGLNSDSSVVEDFYYLRSLGDDPRGKDISDLSKHFPELSKDLRIPQLFPESAFFSSVFRITSPSVQLWTHYDTCDNILIQVKGRKRIVLFPPWAALELYLDGDKSVVLDIDKPDIQLFPNFIKAQWFEGILEEGDIVFIPSLWFHNITALDFSVSVNVFWKNLDPALYDKKDTYGNRDVIPAQLSFRTFDKALTQLKELPTEYQDFYLRRMIISLQNKLDTLQLSKLSN